MNVYYINGYLVGDELYHHGIKGQKWGVRRYQNPDGSLTPLGQKKYGSVENFKLAQGASNKAAERYKKSMKRSSSSSGSKIGNFVSKHKKGLAIAGGVLATAGGVAIYKAHKDAQIRQGAEAFERLMRYSSRLSF